MCRKLFLSLIFCVFSFAVQASEPMTKSTNDTREYAYKTLENGLKLVVISDPKAQRAAVAVDVSVGSGSDPDEFLGLAHFLEHMLFLGTDKYPASDEFMTYISQHGGSNNAFTAFDHTNYFFDIDPDYLKQGLDRFARFFVAPKMAKEYVSRERYAVHAEYQSKLREQGWRNFEVFKESVNPKHPFSRFTVGSLETLPEDSVHPALWQFYKDYYSADRMSAVILGKETPEVLLQWGTEMFSPVPKRANLKSTAIQEKFLTNLPRLVKSQSLSQEKTLNVSFALPYHPKNSYHKSDSYLAYILGYEGEGSLSASLKKDNLITYLRAGGSEPIGSEMLFELEMGLTDEGLTNKDQILSRIFQHIDLIRQDDNGKARYDEIALEAKTAFQYQEKTEAMDKVSQLAYLANHYETKDILALEAIYQGYDKKAIDELLTQMTPSHALVQISAPEFSFEQKTPYFDVPFKAQPWQFNKGEDVQGLFLPKANAFLATDYSLKAPERPDPQLLLENGITLFYYHDTSFNVPRSRVEIALQPQGELSQEQKVALMLFSQVVNEQLVGTLYDASLAGLDGGISADERGVSFSLSGYGEKMPHLLEVMLKTFTQKQIDKALFERVKKAFAERLEDFGTQMPFRQTFAYLDKAQRPYRLLPEEALVVLQRLDQATVKQQMTELLKNLSVQMMVYGNHRLDEAKVLAELVAKNFPSSNLSAPWQQEKLMPVKASIQQSFDVKHQDHAIVSYFVGQEGAKARAAMGLWSQMISSPFFNRLRTEKQLGYVVVARSHPMYQRAGLAFVVESPTANNETLNQEIIQFVKDESQALDVLTEEEFAQQKAIFITELSQQAKNLNEAAERYWANILLTQTTEDDRLKMIEALNKMSKDDFVVLMKNQIHFNEVITITAEPTL